MTDYQDIVVTHPREGVMLATLNRPERRNAMSFRMFDELLALQHEVDADSASRVLILTGAGLGFCAGLDLDAAATLPDMTADEMLEGQEHWARAVSGFRTINTPVIAAVNGAAAGAGFGLALAADIRVCSTKARFNAAFVKIGLSAGDTGTSWTLPRIVGFGRASEILLTGRFVDANEALRIGLVTDVVEPEDLLDRAFETADHICSNSPFGMRMTKQILQTNVDAPSLQAALEVENRTQVLASRTADMTEAMAAFREKRAPRFTGR